MFVLHLKRQLHRRLLKITLAVLIILLSLQWLIPALGLYALKQWYSEQGEGYELIVEDWTFSPWRGLVQFKNVRFQYAQQMSSFNELTLNIAMLDLAKRNLAIEYARFDGMKLTVNQDEEGVNLLGLSSSLLQNEDANNPQRAAEESVSESVSASDAPETPSWTFEIRDVELNNHVFAFSRSSADIAFELTHIGVTGINPLREIRINSEVIIHSLQNRQPAISINEPVTIKLNGSLQQLMKTPSFNGDLIVENMKVATPWLPDSGFKRVMLSNISASKELQSLSQLDIEALFIEEQMLSLKHYYAQDIRFKDNTLTTGLHEWGGLSTTLNVNEDGGLEQLTLDKTDSQPSQAQAPADNTGSNAVAENQTPFNFFITEIRQDSQQPSYINIRNSHVNPTLNLGITLNQLVVKNINNQQETISLMLEAKSDEYSRIMLESNVASKDQINGDIVLKIDQFDLVPLNGYVAKAIGYHVEQGQLNLGASVKINQGQLSGDAQLLVRNSNLIPEDQATMDRISKQISMPIETVLSLIKDDDNNMEMNIPIKGDINAPDFGVDDLISQLGQKALTSATLHYIKQAIFPYGLLVSVADYVGDELFSISLTPIVFVEDELDEKQQGYLLKVVALMNDKASLQLRVCAQVDKAEKTQDWQQMALDKANKIKRFLVDQDETLSPRIVLCQPKIGDVTQIKLGF